MEAVYGGITAACLLKQRLEDDLETRIMVWNVFSRALFLIYFIAFVQLPHQVMGLFGSRGVSPVHLKLEAFKRDFPRSHLLYFPSLFWINSSDAFIQLLPCVGTMCAAVGVWNGYNFYLMLACWTIYRSMLNMSAMILPWDCMLNEAGFYGLFLTRSAIPHPVAAFAFRWLFFRVMIGFGKFKFSGTGPNDKLFIRSFLTFNPIPSRIGYMAQRYLPDWAIFSGLVFMFIAEVPVPFGLLMGGWIRVFCTFISILLHVLIFMSGHFGFFNVIAPIMCIHYFDLGMGITSINRFHPLMLLLPAHLMALLGTSGVNFTWWYSPGLMKLDPLRALYRILKPFYIVNSFGVIPPHSLPCERFIVSYEGSNDCRTWKSYEYKYSVNPPWFMSPYQPRLEFLHYWSFLRDGTDTFAGADNPYGYSKITMHQRIVQRLLEKNCAFVNTLFKSNPFPNQPPKYVRAIVYMYKPQHKGCTNNKNPFYDKFFMHEHVPPSTSNPRIWEEWPPKPETWHFDAYVWRTRYDREHPHAFRSVDASPSFWEFIKNYRYQPHDGASTWGDNVTESVMQLREQHSYEEIKELERQLSKLTWILYRSQLHKVFKKIEFTTPCTHYGYMGFLAHTIIMRGEQFYMQALKDESIVINMAKNFNFEQGLWLYTHFWYDAIITQCRKARFGRHIIFMRLDDAITKFLPEFSSIAFIGFIQQQFVPRTNIYPTLDGNSPNVSKFDVYRNPSYYIEVGERLPLYDYNRKGLILQKLDEKDL